jgi:hypothetical protein
MDEVAFSFFDGGSQSDAEVLTRVFLAAKRHWGYPERWIERWRESLTITPDFVRRSEVYTLVGEAVRSSWNTCGCLRNI